MAIGNRHTDTVAEDEQRDGGLDDRVSARRIALMAQWATAVLDLEDMHAYADELALAAASGDAGLLNRIRDDFRAAGIDIIDAVLEDRMVALLRCAAEELRRSQPGPAHDPTARRQSPMN
ncbi:MAG: ATPase inhibitor subunit zeta [Rhizobium sp.]|nr:ATPase inhibitor subunit zeta [Rhizobium sp.]